MTWKEFKEAVEKQLEEKGLNEDIDLVYIDTHMPDEVDVEYMIEIDKIAVY